ncbi:hypothetical protein NT6N_21430 [Oceaniferula spumae]|uniref:Uncharacterized protein n=1 Tax=Oceaniferula spumae TaxID=2979115 RepID=A0AAT9FMB2_9BACT
MNGFRKQFDARVAKMVDDLSLNASQEKAMRAYYAEQLGKIDMEALNDLEIDSPKMKEMAAAIRGDGLSDHMKAYLTTGQLEGMKAMQERKRTSQIESAALKNLAKLQDTLDLTQEQRDAAYAVLAEDAENKIASRSDADLVAREVMRAQGIRMDMSDRDMSEMFKSHPIHAADTSGDPQSMSLRVNAQRQQKIDRKVQLMSSVLTEAQLTRYRKSLGGDPNSASMTIETE